MTSAPAEWVISSSTLPRSSSAWLGLPDYLHMARSQLISI
jgi:hypothetical protein